MTNTAAALLASYYAADRPRAAAVAKPRVQRQYRGTGTYPVTVGGIVIGEVRKIEQDDTFWIALDANDNQIGGANRTRTHAVASLSVTDSAVEAYRHAAMEGTFGTAEQARLDAETKALIAALEADAAPATPAPVETVHCARCKADVPADTVNELCPASGNVAGPHLPAVKAPTFGDSITGTAYGDGVTELTGTVTEIVEPGSCYARHDQREALYRLDIGTGMQHLVTWNGQPPASPMDQQPARVLRPGQVPTAEQRVVIAAIGAGIDPHARRRPMSEVRRAYRIRARRR